MCDLSRASPFREVLAPGDPLIAIDGVPVGRLDYAHTLQRLRLLGSWSAPETPHILTFSISLPAMAKVKAIVKAEVEHLQREEAVDAMSRAGRHGAHWQSTTAARLPPRVGSDLIARQSTFASIRSAGGVAAAISKVASFTAGSAAPAGRAANPPWVSPMRGRSTTPVDPRAPRSSSTGPLRSGSFARSSVPLSGAVPGGSAWGGPEEPPEGSAEWARQHELREMQRTMRDHGNFYAAIAGTRGTLGAYFALQHAQEAARLMAAAARYKVDRERELSEASRKRAASRSRSALVGLPPPSQTQSQIFESRSFVHRRQSSSPTGAGGDLLVPGGEDVVVQQEGGSGAPQPPQQQQRAFVSPPGRRGVIAPGRGVRRGDGGGSGSYAAPARGPSPIPTAKSNSNLRGRPLLGPESARSASQSRAFSRGRQLPPHEAAQLPPHEAAQAAAQAAVIRAVSVTRAQGGDPALAPAPSLLEVSVRAATTPRSGHRVSPPPRSGGGACARVGCGWVASAGHVAFSFSPPICRHVGRAERLADAVAGRRLLRRVGRAQRERGERRGPRRRLPAGGDHQEALRGRSAGRGGARGGAAAPRRRGRGGAPRRRRAACRRVQRGGHSRRRRRYGGVRGQHRHGRRVDAAAARTPPRCSRQAPHANGRLGRRGCGARHRAAAGSDCSRC